MKKIIILDEKAGTVFVFSFDPSIYASGDEFIESDIAKSHGLICDECKWMIVDELKITIKE